MHPDKHCFGIQGKAILSLGGLLVMSLLMMGSYTYWQAIQLAEKQAILINLSITNQFSKQVTILVDRARNDLAILQDTPPVQGIIRARENHGMDAHDKDSLKKWQDRMRRIFIAFLKNVPEISQISYLDETGMEMVRVDSDGGTIRIVSEKELQSEADRNYFRETARLKYGQVHYSEIDLNREHGQILLPYQPIYRIAIPVFSAQQKFRGIMAISILGKKLLDSAAPGEKMETYVVNQAGYFLKHTDSAREFGFDLGFDYRIKDEFPELAKLSPSAEEAGMVDVASDSLLTFKKLHFDPNDASRYWMVIHRQPTELVFNSTKKTAYTMLWSGLLITLFSLGVILWLTNRFLLSPIKLLAGTAEKMIEGDLSLRLPEQKVTDEFRLLYQTINTFAEAQQQITSKLERDVLDRTEHLGSVVNNLADGVITIDELGIVNNFNLASERLFGYAAAEVIGKNISILMPEPYHSQHDGYVKSYCATGKAHIIGIGREVTGLHKSGRTFPMYLAISEMILGDRRYFNGIVFDLTERKQFEQSLVAAKEQAEMANRAKDSFLATMSHEIRTPLTGMMGMLELLSITPLNHDQKDTLQAARDSSGSLLRIVSDILDWSKIEEGKMALVPRTTSIPNMLKDVTNTYSHVASAKNLTLAWHADARLGPAHIVDELRLSQVLNNFVSNAIKFTSHGAIELRAELVGQVESGEKILFSVKDTGIGIGKDAQQHLFQRYSQESADTSRMYGGTGLGLSICRRLVEMMDGQINLDSTPEQGATFSITLILPVSDALEDVLPSLHSEEAKKVIKPLYDDSADAPLVLAVDDHPTNRDLLMRQIKLLGLRVETAENGREALSMWREGRFALVITDCHMPEMDGYTFSRAVRQIEVEESLPHTPIIAWSANAVGDEAENCRAAGMDELLLKPANLAQLKEILAKCLSISGVGFSEKTFLQHDEDSDQSASPIDYAVLEQVVPNAAEHLQVLHDFQSHIRTDKCSLIEVLEQGDQINTERIAHRMKGSSRMVGAGDIAKACAIIEQAARDSDMAGARASRTTLDEAIAHFDAFLMKL